MADRRKRSIALPAHLDNEVASAARSKGLSVSGWIEDAVRSRLRLDAGWREVEEWQTDHGRLTAVEIAAGRARAAASLAAAARLGLSEGRESAGAV